MLTDLPMGVLSIVLAANSDTKLSTLTQVCSAYSWLNVGGKLLKLVALKRLFADEQNIKRKLQKLSGRRSCPARMIIYHELTFGGRLLLAASSSAGPDACVDEEGSRSSWSWRQVTRYGLVDWLWALLHGRTRGRAESRSAHSELELLNAAILEEATRQNATESAKRKTDGKVREVTREECPASTLHEPTPPQVRTQLAIRWESPTFPFNQTPMDALSGKTRGG